MTEDVEYGITAEFTLPEVGKLEKHCLASLQNLVSCSLIH